MEEINIRSHLIITDVHEEYEVHWTGSIAGTNPLFVNKMPVFVIRSKEMALEVNTTDVKYLEDIAKRMTAPKGRQAITTDTVSIYIKTTEGKEKLLGTVVHNRVKTFAPVWDTVGYR